MIKKIALALTFISSAAFADVPPNPIVVMDGSVITAEQVAPVQAIVNAWLTKYGTLNVAYADLVQTVPEARAELIGGINAQLALENAPQITDSVVLKFDFPYITEDRKADYVGVKIADGQNLFCLPCQIDPATFKWGIVAFVLPPPPPTTTTTLPPLVVPVPANP